MSGSSPGRQARAKGNNYCSKRPFASSCVSYSWIVFLAEAVSILYPELCTLYDISYSNEKGICWTKEKIKSYLKVGISLADFSASWMLVLWYIHIETHFYLHLIFFPTEYILQDSFFLCLSLSLQISSFKLPAELGQGVCVWGCVWFECLCSNLYHSI